MKQKRTQQMNAQPSRLDEMRVDNNHKPAFRIHQVVTSIPRSSDSTSGMAVQVVSCSLVRRPGRANKAASDGGAECGLIYSVLCLLSEVKSACHVNTVKMVEGHSNVQ